MNQQLEKLYYKLPVIAQNIAISLMGFKLNRERYATAGREMLKILEETQSYNKQQLREYQNQAFVAVARHAIETTFFYGNWAKDNKIQSSDIRSLEDINLFPVIEKQYLRENAAKFRSSAPQLANKQFILHTSGTTGTPLNVYTDKDSRSRHYAFFSRLRRNYGLGSRDKRVTLFGRIILLAEQKRPPFWRYDVVQPNLLMSSYHLNRNNLMHYYNKLLEYKPQEIFAYPSSVFALADFIYREQLTPIKLKLLMTTAENLLPEQRQIIAKAFDAPIVNQYGCTEMAFFCSDQPDGEMKFHPEHGYAEIRRSDNQICDTGEGEFIATGFINLSMPVIRYAIGDNITLTGNDNRGLQVLASVTGRTDDVIYSINGTPVGRLDPIFKGGNGIRYAQIVQAENASVLLKLVPDDTYTDAHGQSLRNELIKRLGRETPVQIVLVDNIEKSSNGKFRPVISYFKQGPLR